MPRPLRVDFDGAVHHVMNRGVNRQAIFFDDRDRIEFGRRLADIHEQLGVETIAYCLMGNHYHLLIRTPHGGLPAAMHRLASLYVRHTNDRIGRDGPLFRARYHSILVTTDAYLLTAMRYIHRNPLELAGGSVDDYRWSSFRSYVGWRATPSFLNTDLVLGYFGHNRRELASFHRRRQATDGGHQPSDAADVAQLLGLAIAEDDLHHGDDSAPTPWLTRTLTNWLIDTCPGAPWHTDLAAQHPFPSAAARNMALRRARQRASSDPVVSRITTRLRSLLADQDLAA